MNEKMRNQVAEMKKQTIGVEVEMNSITRRNAAKLAAEFFGTECYQDTAYRNGYCTWSAWDAQGREWKFQRDSSIHGPDDERCEMVTPILTYADMDTLQELVRRLRKAPPEGAGSTSTSEPRATPRRASATWRTSWPATKASWRMPSTSTAAASPTTARWSAPGSSGRSTSESPAP